MQTVPDGCPVVALLRANPIARPVPVPAEKKILFKFGNIE
jgi:hypothetical protein